MHCPYKHVHFVGIGGIHVSALAKLALALGVSVSGSDLVENEQTEELRKRGMNITIGQAAENVPIQTEAIAFSSAANEANIERAEGARRGLPAFNSHQFLGLLGKDMKQIVISGTHGKSTTTALLGVMLKEAGLQPTVVVGTQAAQLAEGNIEIGASDWLVIEGDEFDHHFLSYHPTVLVINNIEGDHFDIYPTVEAMREAYRALLGQIVDGGALIMNSDDTNCQVLLDEERPRLQARSVKIVSVGDWGGAEVRLAARRVVDGFQEVDVQSLLLGRTITLTLAIPGEMNARNAAMCYAVGECLELPLAKIVSGLVVFRGVWRRQEKIGEKNGVTVFSDYGHHPTAVTKTLEALKEFYPGRRLVLCFQPHHRNRTKHLFTEFSSCFDTADILLLVEIYDVKGRDQAADGIVSSKDLIEAVKQSDEKRNVTRPLLFAQDPAAALEKLQTLLKSGDVLIVMGAGDIYKIAYALV